MRNNRKGFTVVELILSFLFVMFIALGMFKMLVSFRAKSETARLEGDMETFRVSLLGAIYGDINNKILMRMEMVPRSRGCFSKVCIDLHFNDGDTKRFEIQEHAKLIDEEEMSFLVFVYDNVKYIPPNPQFSTIEWENNPDSQDKNNIEGRGPICCSNKTIYKLNYPMYHDDLPGKDYGVKIVAIGYNSTPNSCANNVSSCSG